MADGLRKGLTSYGDAGFSLFLRKAFIKAMGYSDDALNRPIVVITVGPMVVGHHKGEVLGACTDCRRLWGKYRAGEIDDVEIEAVNGRLAPSVGTCMVMGTASTMACVTEALGLSLPMSATI